MQGDLGVSNSVSGSRGIRETGFKRGISVLTVRGIFLEVKWVAMQGVFYSYFNAVTGSTRIARRAGT